MLASGFSHELNTPLATVLTCVEGILRDARAQEASPEWSGVRESATIAREQILRCRGITQHFLRLSRGQRSAATSWTCELAVRAVARLIEPTARAHGVQIDVGPLPPGLHVRADEAELQHALINLLLNAVQACRPGGHVTLTAERDELLRMRVTDDGCGIPADEQQAHLRAVLQPAQGRHRARSVPVAQLRAPLGRRHRRRERAGPRLDVRDSAAAGDERPRRRCHVVKPRPPCCWSTTTRPSAR